MNLEQRIEDYIEDLIEIVITAFICILAIEAFAYAIVSVLVSDISVELSGLIITILAIVVIAYLERELEFSAESLMEEFGLRGIIGLVIAHIWAGNLEMATLTPVLYVLTRMAQDRHKGNSQNLGH